MITMKQLLTNPSGPYSAYFARRDLTIKDLEKRFDTLYKRENGNIKYFLFRKLDSYIFYVKMPSETFSQLVYDVVIELSPNNDKDIEAFNINNYSARLFSNSLNFTFTYAYVYNKDGILIDELKEKVSKRALTEEPGKRNPIQSYGFEKSVYFSLLLIKMLKLNFKSILNSKSEEMSSYTKIFNSIKTSESKINEYNKLKKAISEKKKSEKKVAKKEKTGYNKYSKRSSTKTKSHSYKPNMTRNMKLKK